MRGRIEKALSGFYYVNVGQQVLQCRARGKFRREGTSPLVGDWVQVRELGGGASVSEICRNISIGALSAATLILFILPGILATMDKFIVKKIADEGNVE